MKKIALIMLLMVAALGARGENADITRIRQIYSDAKAQIAMGEEEIQARNMLETHGQYMIPGCGPTDELVRCYFKMQYSSDGEMTYQPYFITRTRNIAARNYYDEFLFDEDGMLVFFYEKMDNEEVRCYWGEEGVIVRGGGDSLIEVGEAYSDAVTLQLSYVMMMNRHQ